MIRAVVFDLDNTLTDFMGVKQASIDAAVDAMIDAGLDARLGLTQPEARTQADDVAQTLDDAFGGGGARRTIQG